MKKHLIGNVMSFRRLVQISVPILVMVIILLNSSASYAHPGGPAHHNTFPEHGNDVMRRFWRDQAPTAALQALAASNCVSGTAAGYECSNIDLLAFMPLADVGGDRSNSAANDIWGWTDGVTGKEYAILGRVFGTSFVDISDPQNPVYLGDLPTHGAFGSSWRDIKTYADHAFIVSEANQHGMQVFDLSQLRSVTNPPVTFTETAHYNKNSSAHNIIINEDSGFAYIVGASGKNGCNGGLHMVNINNPTSPSFAGCFSADGYTHDAQCVNYIGPDIGHQGDEICFNSNEDTITIVNVTNKSNPIQISRTGYNGAAYTHQGWLTEDQAYFLLDDELDEQNTGDNTRTRVWDVSDLENPLLIGSYLSNNTAIDHNQYIKGGYSYQANYRSGLRILDISGVASASLTEVAYFDIYPGSDSANFNGAWSNYPYFDSGVVIVSGIEQGLFILRPNLGQGSDPLTVSITDPVDGALVSGSTVTLAATAGGGNGVTGVDFIVNGQSVGSDSTSPYSVSWDSTGTPDGSVTVEAVASDGLTTSSDSVTVIVDNVPDPTVHVADLDGSSVSEGKSGKWLATVTITVHNSTGGTVENATVFGSWSNGGSGSDSCLTNGSGFCPINLTGIRRNAGSVTFMVTNVTFAGSVYEPNGNGDPDVPFDSDGTVINISAP